MHTPQVVVHATQGEGPLTDNPLEISDATSDGPEDWAEGDDLPVVEARGLFVVLAKALRAFQIYDDSNPVRKRFVTSLREAFEQLWLEVEGLNLLVEEHRIVLVWEQVYENSSRSDSLAFLLYKDHGCAEVWHPRQRLPHLNDYLI